MEGQEEGGKRGKSSLRGRCDGAFLLVIDCGSNLQESSGTNTEEEEEEVLDEETLRKDQGVNGSIEVLIREYANELNAPSQDPDSQPRNKKRKEKKEEVGWRRWPCATWRGPLAQWCRLFPLGQEDISAMEIEEDKRDLISREISKFRDTHKVTFPASVSSLNTCWRRKGPLL